MEKHENKLDLKEVWERAMPAFGKRLGAQIAREIVDAQSKDDYNMIRATIYSYAKTKAKNAIAQIIDYLIEKIIKFL